MQNIDIRFRATSNFGDVKAQMAALTVEAENLKKTIESQAYSKTPGMVDPVAWQRGTEAVSRSSREYLKAISSSNLLNATQITATSETKKYTEALQKQKLTFGEMIKNRGIMKEVYNDQLRMQRMTVQGWGTDTSGRMVTTVTVPKGVPEELDTMRRKVGMLGNEVASASTGFLNMGKNIQWSGRQLMVGFTYPMVLFGAAAGVMAFKVETAMGAINKVYDFSAKSLTNSSLRDKEILDLRTKSFALAAQSAKDYGTSMVDTLKAEQTLAATGLKGQNLLSTTKEVNRISAIGDIAPEETSQMIISLQTAFRSTIKPGKDMTDTLNYLNSAANATSLSLQDIVTAVPKAAAVMASMGGNVKDLTLMLVSMRESGVNAAEGANAIKSAVARVIDPVPKAIKYYEKFGISLTDISKQSGGKIIPFMKLLGVAQEKIVGTTVDETNRLKEIGLKDLFGVYQVGKLTGALRNITDAYGGVIKNQSSKVLDINKMTTAQLQKEADASLKAMIDTPSGKLKVAWASLQPELVKIGDVALAVGAKVVSGISHVAHFFNGMSDWKKNSILAVLAIMAIAGPVIMLSGLFINLASQAGKGVGAFLKLIGISEILTEKQKAERMATEAQSAAFDKQIIKVSTLTDEVTALTDAMIRGAEAGGRVDAGNLGLRPPGQVGPLNSNGNFYGGQATLMPPPVPTKGGGSPLITPPLAPIPMETTAPSVVGNPILRGARASEVAKAQANADARVAGIRAAALEERRLADETAATARMQTAVNGKITGMNAGLAVGGLAMGGMLASSMGMLGPMNGFVGEVSKLTMIGVIVVPALIVAVQWIKKAAVETAAWAALQTEQATAAIAGSVATYGAAGGIKNLAKTALTSFSALLGPIGLVGLGVGAIAIAGLAWQHHQEGIRKEITATSLAANDLGNVWARSLGEVEKKYKDITQASNDAVQVQKDQSIADSLTSTDAGKASVKAFSSIKPNSPQQLVMSNNYGLEAMVKYGNSAQEAATKVRVLYQVAGYGAIQAAEAADKFIARFQKMSGTGIQEKYFQNQLNALTYQGQGTKEWDTAANDAVAAFRTAFDQAKPVQSNKLFSDLGSGLDQQYQKAFDTIMSKNQEYGPKWLKSLNITDGAGLRQLFELNGSNISTMKQSASKMSDYLGEDVKRALTDASGASDALIQKIATDTHGLGRNIPDTVKKFNELRIAIESAFPGKFTTWDEGKVIISDLDRINKMLHPTGAGSKTMVSGILGPGFMAGAQDMSKAFDGMSEKQALVVVNQMNANNHFAQGADLTQAIANYMGQVTAQTNNAASAASKFASNMSGVASLSSIRLTGADAVGAAQKAMGAVQSMMVAGSNSAFDAKWQGITDAANKSAQGRQTALDNMHTKAKDALQKQIDAEKNADKIRQQLFANEKARLQELATLANAQIDFAAAINTGNLDEAAKIQNNMNVTSSSNQMDKDNQAAQDASDAKVAMLQKRETEIDKIYARRQKAASEAAANEMKSIEKTKSYDKASLDARNAMFVAYTATNQKDLERWMSSLGLTYANFGGNLSKQGGSWSNTFKSTLSDQLHLAGLEVANATLWKGIAANSAKQLLNGLGFQGPVQFSKFVTTGTLPKGYTGQPITTPETHHGGGWVGSGGYNRGNIPNTYEGLHPSEKMVRAQKGEFIMNKEASSLHRHALENMNRGIYGGGDSNATIADYNASSGFGAIYGLIAGIEFAAYEKAIQTAMKNGINGPKGKSAATGTGRFSVGASIANLTSSLTGFVAGPGGKHAPTTPGGHGPIHDVSTGYPAVDFARPTGSPAYAVSDGVISRSEDIRGFEPRRPGGQDGYRSYGRVMYLKTNAGPEVLYAHLSQRGLAAGAHVSGGSVIGRTGDTGNSTGPHLHFGSRGASPLAWLRNGGEVKWDNTKAVLHEGETVLTKSLTEKFKSNVASGGASEYNVTIDMRNSNIAKDVDVERAMDKWWNNKEARTGRKKVVR